MQKDERQSLVERISAQQPSLTPRSRTLADYILHNPRKVVFMTIKQLAAACQVSESSVVRFIGQMGYRGYPSSSNPCGCRGYQLDAAGPGGAGGHG